MPEKENWANSIPTSTQKRTRQNISDSGNCDGINFLAASYYIQSITDIYKTFTGQNRK